MPVSSYARQTLMALFRLRLARLPRRRRRTWAANRTTRITNATRPSVEFSYTPPLSETDAIQFVRPQPRLPGLAL
jgi:hypothetical protein